MKTCLIYCGNARTVADTWLNQKWYLRHLNPSAIFVSVADDQQADDMRFIRQAFPKAEFFMEKVVQPTIPEPVPTTKFHVGYPPSASPQAILKQLWALNRAWQFVGEKANEADFDLFVRVRPDVAFCRTWFRWQKYHRLVDDVKAALSYDLRRNVGCDIPMWWCGPRWAKWGGVNDRFAVMGRQAAESFFTTYQKKDLLWDAGCPLHPETMFDASLELDGIVPDDTGKFEFKTTRLPSAEHPTGGWVPIDVSGVDLLDAIR